MSRHFHLIIKTVASSIIGHGHVMRCRALAKEARRRGLAVGFETRDDYTYRLLQFLGEEVTEHSFPLEGAKFIIRDFLNGSPQSEVAREVADGAVVLLIDDHGPARREASIVSDVFITSRQMGELVEGPTTTYLYGLPYAPLSRQFATNHAEAEPGLGGPPKLFICFGGSDPYAITPKFVESLDRAGWLGPATIIVPSEHKDQVLQIVNHWTITQVLENVDNISELMKTCDLAVTKLGLVMLEAFCIGLGCVLIEPTRAHLDLATELEALQESWPAIEFGLADELDFNLAARKTVSLLNNEKLLADCGRRGAKLVDGLGVNRLIDALLAEAGQ